MSVPILMILKEMKKLDEEMAQKAKQAHIEAAQCHDLCRDHCDTACRDVHGLVPAHLMHASSPLSPEKHRKDTTL